MTLPRSDHFNGKTFVYPGETVAQDRAGLAPGALSVLEPGASLIL